MHTRFGSLGAAGWNLVATISGLLLAAAAATASDWRILTDLDEAAYDAALIAQQSDGRRLTCLTAYAATSGPRYCAIFEKSGGIAWQQQRGLTQAAAQSWITAQAALGYRPIALVGTGATNAETYAVVLAQFTGPPLLTRLNQTPTQLTNAVNNLGGQGYRIHAISAWGSGVNRRYATIWTQDNGAGWWYGTAMSPAQFADNQELVAMYGFRLVTCSADGLTSGATQQASWAPLANPEGAPMSALGQTQAQLASTADDMQSQGYAPRLLNGYPDADGVVRYNTVWTPPASIRTWKSTGRHVASLSELDDAMQELMQRSHIPAGQLAVTRGGRLVLNRAYTWAEDGFPITQVGNRFRIASVTKTTATATAVLQLIERGQLTLNTTMLSVLGGTWSDARVANITVRQLLQHTGGWNRGISGDPVFQDRTIAAALGVPLPITQAHIVQYMRTRALDHTPGTVFAYSNFGYLLLGQIVEALSGQDFDQYVSQHVWNPLRPDDGPRPGDAFLPQPNEPPYVDLNGGMSPSAYGDQVVDTPYGSFNMDNCKALGDYTVSARDLARFTASFTNPATSPILTSGSISTAWNDRVSLGGGYGYGLGWIYTPTGLVAASGFWHDGALPGTQAWIKVRSSGGVTWTVVLDANPSYSTDLYANYAVDEVIDPVIDAIAEWPGGDLWCPEDVSLDRSIDLTDLAILLTNFGRPSGATLADGDVDGDGDVDLTDLATLLTAFGTAC